QVGVSYARDAEQDDNQQKNLDIYDDGVQSNISDIVDVAANYVNSFGAFDVALSGRYGFANDDSGGDPTVWGGGLNLGYAGFTIGGSYAEQNGASFMNGQAWDAGVSYETGPWGFSFTYMNGENVDDETVGIAADGDEQLQQYLLGVNYTLAKGVALNGFGAYADFDEDVSDGGAGGGNDVDGWVLGTGIKISF
ncbi:MAG TPA: porin, partial [Pararhizobium sp.]|nr:porin [Pararhizobium sp.]